MARYRMDDGTVLDTDKASKSWDEAQTHDGRNFISVATGSQWAHQTLYRSRKGRYYLECSSAYQGTLPHAEWISNHEAARWLLANKHDDSIPEELKALIDEVSE